MKQVCIRCKREYVTYNTSSRYCSKHCYNYSSYNLNEDKKRCCYCKVYKTLDQFILKSNGRYRAECRECNKDRARIYSRLKEKNDSSTNSKMHDRARFGGNKKGVLERDNYTCQYCGMTNDQHKDKWGREITVHHLDGNGRNSDKPNNNINNLITVCLSCHSREDGKRKKNK